MAKAILRPVFRLLVGVFGAVALVFFLVRLTADPAVLFAPPGSPPEQIEIVRQQLGLDRHVLVQFWDFLVQLAQGDLGRSYYWRTDVGDLIMNRLWATLELALLALLVSVIIGVGLGLIAAMRRGKVVDRLLVAGAMLGQAIPTYWAAPILVLLFGVELMLLPIGGRGSWETYILPVITLCAFQLAVIFRITRTAALDSLSNDFAKLARAKGASEPRVAVAHVLPNTFVPVLTVSGMALANLIGGSVIVEVIFSWPGLGQLMIQAVNERDFPVVQGIALVFAVGYVLINTLVDLLYPLIDPRLKVR